MLAVKAPFLSRSIESERSILKDLLKSTVSERQKLFGIGLFYLSVDEKCSPLEKEAYYTEFLDPYIRYLKQLNIECIDPELTGLLIARSKEIASEPFIRNRKEIDEGVVWLTGELQRIRKVLQGESGLQALPSKPCFPLLEPSVLQELDENFGFLDSITVTIKGNEKKNSLAVFPALLEHDEVLEQQIRLSLQVAIAVAENYIKKLSPFHTISIQFDEHFSYYSGDSMGLALTVAIIGELLAYYNAQYSISTVSDCVFTGGIREGGIILPVGASVITRKLAAVFYSSARVFIIHKADGVSAQEKLEELNSKYPARHLELVEVTSLSDLLNRRNVIEIKKKSLISRGIKGLKRNWFQAAAMIVFLVVLGFYFWQKTDDNPVGLETSGNTIRILNITGRELMVFPLPESIYREQIKRFVNLIDIDNDGTNEMLFTHDNQDWKKYPGHYGRVVCLDKDSTELWSYRFTDTASSAREFLEGIYTIHFIGIYIKDGRKSIVLHANNVPSYSSTVFMLDAETGKRVGGTYWQSGFIESSILADYNEDGQPDIIVGGTDNGFEEATLTCISIDKLGGVRPSTPEYEIRYKPRARLLFSFRFPQTDYLKYYGLRQNGVMPHSIEILDTYLKFMIHENQVIKRLGYSMRYHLKEKYFAPFMHDDFRVARDSLVAKGILSPPYTDTKEYLALLKNQVLSWDGEKWVKYHQEGK